MFNVTGLNGLTKEQVIEHIERLPKLLSLMEQTERAKSTVDSAMSALMNAQATHGNYRKQVRELGGSI